MTNQLFESFQSSCLHLIKDTGSFTDAMAEAGFELADETQIVSIAGRIIQILRTWLPTKTTSNAQHATDIVIPGRYDRCESCPLHLRLEGDIEIVGSCQGLGHTTYTTDDENILVVYQPHFIEAVFPEGANDIPL